MNLALEQPAFLWLGLLVIPLVVAGWRSAWAMDGFRRSLTLGLRVLLMLLLVVLLADPRIKREHDQLTVIGLLDISGSVRRFAQLPPPEEGDVATRSYVTQLRDWLRSATTTRGDEDRFGLVVFDGEALAALAPTSAPFTEDQLDLVTMPGTSIDDAIRLGLAMFPADTARRLVLITDGNETIGDAREASRLAAGANDRSGIPIDVLPIVYEIRGDAQIARLEVPPYAQPGQTITARIVIESTTEMTGRLGLRREGTPIDLNGDGPGTARPVRIPAGVSVHLATITLGDTPVNRFEALFTPDDPDDDVLADNNRIEAFSATPGPGRILIVDRHADDRVHPLATILREASLPVETRTSDRFPRELLEFQNFDLIVLDNIPSYDLATEQHTMLVQYVQELGGGLLMIGGESGFGAGGWNGTDLEAVLPLDLDPPRELRRPAAALVLVLDNSGSMARPVGGARASQQEVANEAAARAIESLYSESLVGVITFNEFPRTLVELQRNDDSAAIAERVRSIGTGGGTNLAPALERAHDMLRNVEADRKRIVCLSDGRSPTDRLEAIVASMLRDDIRLTTIAIGDEADHATLKRLAAVGEGEFHPVFNPTALPRVLVDSVQVINKPLIKEGAFAPVVVPTGSALTANLGNAPELLGLVVTGPKPESSIELTHPDGEPLLARWQAGLGRVAAFTSDLGGPWSDAWRTWPVAPAFWTQLARDTARPSTGHDAELVAEIRDDRLVLTLDAVDERGRFLDYLDVAGTVYAPNGTSSTVRLPQTGPGRYEVDLPARHAGNYIVALAPRRGERQLNPMIGGATRATGEEFRQRASNLPLLRDVIEITGGRELDLQRPDAVDLFDRSDMAPHRSYLPAWRWIVAITIGLLLLDVANRRIAWRTRDVRAAAERALTRATPSHVHGSAAAATLASLREATVPPETPERPARAAAKSPPPAASPPPPPTRPKRLIDVSDALARLRGKTKEKPPAPPDTPADEPEEPADPGEAASETTSSLLEAKRRARKRLEE